MNKYKLTKASDNIVTSCCVLCRRNDCVYKKEYENSYNEMIEKLKNLEIPPITQIDFKCRFHTV